MGTTRRNFMRLSALGSAALIGGTNAFGFSSGGHLTPDELTILSENLLQEWVDALLKLQVTDITSPDYGGILCPACGNVHGRVADSVYPLLFMADSKKQQKYIDAAILLYRWMEKHVSEPDGSWRNDVKPGSWKGITVFTCIALAETIKYHGSLLPADIRNEMTSRLKKAGDYIHTKFSFSYGNINYPISASYGLSLLGILLNEPKFTEKGKAFAHEAVGFLTKNNRLIHGEGGPYDKPSPKGCFSIDLGYNVEESLPSLVLYSKLTNDRELLDSVIPSLQSHMEFMLPDGAWDNSWGTRNFKWTYWGSRTSDGCQTAYALMADHDPRFYRVALKNTELLKSATYNGLLYGGPHYVSHKILPCVHHTFCHAKALAAILDHGIPVIQNKNAALPREKVYGGRFIPDVQTWLVSRGGFRATVTGYDREYGMKNGHATGGALSLLWHEKTGPLLSASMNEYQMKEPGNMQPDNDPHSMPLTPRLQMESDGTRYMNICDLSAEMETSASGKAFVISARSMLRDKDQNQPPAGEIRCQSVYTFEDNRVVLEFKTEGQADSGAVKIILPVICSSAEKYEIITAKKIRFYKKNAVVNLAFSHDVELLPTTGGRVFNFVPGLEAVPLAVNGEKCRVEIEVGDL